MRKKESQDKNFIRLSELLLEFVSVFKEATRNLIFFAMRQAVEKFKNDLRKFYVKVLI
jgi:hypothetical protein